MIDPPNPPPVISAPMWVWILAALGAVVGYLEDLKREDEWKVWIGKALTHAGASGLCALMAYHALLAAAALISDKFSNIDLQVLVIGIAAHMGTEGLKAAGEWLRGKMS